MATFAQIFTPALSGLQFDGVALASGLVYFYVPGTGTFKTIYTNRTKTVTAANPYTLDANGQAEIFGDGVYDVVVKTSGGVTKATWENVELALSLDGYTVSTTPGANQIPALDANSILSLPNAVHLINGNKIFHAGNDGASSTLDADKLDGQEGSYYAPIASPTFTGVPAAPTATAGTNTTQVATTAFVIANNGLTVTNDASTFSGNNTVTPPSGALIYFLSILESGASNTQGSVEVRWMDGASEIRTWTKFSGTNANSGADGGSGMSDMDSVSIPIFDGTDTLEFRPLGNGYNATSIGWLRRI